MRIPVTNLRPAIEAAEPAWRGHLAEMFARGQFILGEQVAAFEAELAGALGAKHAVGVGTGTAALELSLREAGLAGSRRKVLTTSLTAPFTAVAIMAAGCGLQFADVDPETLLLDPEDAGNRATRATAALIPVHLYGRPCPLDRLAALARDLRAVMVQDACQAHGGCYRGRPFTAFSRHVAYSFYPTKNLGCLGDGGAVLTDRAAAARTLRILRDGGRAGGHVSRLAGINSRLDEMQACYLRAFLPHLAEWNAQRARIAAIYRDALAGCPGVRLPADPPGSVCHLFVIRVRRREPLRRYLAGHGIGTAVHYPVPLHVQPAFGGCGLKRGDLPHAERACREVLSLPLWPYMPDDAAVEVAARIRRFQ
jgi:dTDP-3-amino-3,4,6-trideoxy-alpha-D-glucose transaminase